MEICVKCSFDNEPEFEKALDYLKSIAHDTDRYVPDILGIDRCWYIIDHSLITQNQLDELTALCPIRPKREISKQHVYSKIAFGIGLYGSSYNPDDMLDDDTLEDCKILGLDPSAITHELMVEFEIK